MTQVTSFLNTHRAIVAMQKRYNQSPAPAQKYGLFFLIIFRHIISKQGASATLVSLSLAGLYSLFKGRSLLQSLIDKVNALTTSHERLSSNIKDLRYDLNESVKSLTGKTDKIFTEVEKAEKIKALFGTLKEGMNGFFKVQEEERIEFCTLFKEIRQENAVTKEAIDKKFEEMKEASKSLAFTLRELFSPISEFNKRLKSSDGEMDRLATIIEQIIGDS